MSDELQSSMTEEEAATTTADEQTVEETSADECVNQSDNEPEAEVEATDAVDEAVETVDETKIVAHLPRLQGDALKGLLEAAIFAAGETMSLKRLMALFPEDDAPSKEELQQALEQLTEDYAERGVSLMHVSSGYRFQAKTDYAPYLQKLWEKKPPRFSRAMLETLALIAYRQPITRGEIEEVRGVSTSSHIMKVLQEREWVKIVGYKDVPGKPALYGTTKEFLDYFNLKQLKDMPDLKDLIDLDEKEKQLNEQLVLNMALEERTEEGVASDAVIAPEVIENDDEGVQEEVAGDQTQAVMVEPDAEVSELHDEVEQMDATDESAITQDNDKDNEAQAELAAVEEE